MKEAREDGMTGENKNHFGCVESQSGKRELDTLPLFVQASFRVWRLLLCLALFIPAYSQTVTPTPDFQKIADDYIAEHFYPLSYLGDLKEYGNSPSLNAEVAFLGLSSVQKENYILYLKKMEPIYRELKKIFYDYARAKDDSEREKINEKNKFLKMQIMKNVPSDLKNIFGNEIYKRYSDFVLWKTLFLNKKANESNEKNRKWEMLDKLNDRELADKGVADETERRLALDALYQYYQDFVQCQNEIANAAPPQWSRRQKKYSADLREDYIQKFIEKKGQRKIVIENVEKKEKITEGVEKDLDLF